MKHSAGWLIALRCTRPRHRSSLLLYERGRSELRALEALLHQRVRCLTNPLPVRRDPLLPWAWFPSRTLPVPRWWTLRRAGRSRYLYPGADGEPSTPCAGGVCPRRKAAAHRSGCGPLGVVDVQRAGPTGWTSQLSVGHTVLGVAEAARVPHVVNTYCETRANNCGTVETRFSADLLGISFLVLLRTRTRKTGQSSPRPTRTTAYARPERRWGIDDLDGQTISHRSHTSRCLARRPSK
jgi:hypothetical protein